MTPEGVKTAKSDLVVTEQFVRKHLEVGISALEELRDFGSSIRHLRFEERPG
jgi:AMP nucleosidase